MPNAADTVHDLVRVSGPDAITFLQGQLSQDVAALSLGEAAPTFVLSPQGRVDAWGEVRRAGEDVVELTVSAGWGEALEARLRRFLLRTDARIERTTIAGTALEEAERIAAGVPAMGKEIDDRTIPAETGWVERSVSFTKGCFVGQELVARMDSRSAEPPRRLVRLRVSAPVGAAVAGAAIDAGDTAAGEVTSAVWSESRAAHLALGYVRRGTDLAGKLQVAGFDAVVDGLAGA